MKITDDIPLKVPNRAPVLGRAPVVILGPNGSGKTRLAQAIAAEGGVTAISAQRRTWLDDNLPVQPDETLRNEVKNRENNWRNEAWQPTTEINYLLSRMIQQHASRLTDRNRQAIESGTKLDPVTDTDLIKLQIIWSRVYPKRELEISGFFPRVKRLDGLADGKPYSLKQMSDGERTVLYMAARVLTADDPIILVDEPELHLHGRLAVTFWNEMEQQREDCRFVYVTHDLNFTLSRRAATVLVAQSGERAEELFVDGVPASVAAEILGAATLPFHAKRIILYEGEQTSGFASELMNAWFVGDETFALPVGDRDSVFAAVSGLRKIGVVAAEVQGLVDRDFYPDSILANVTDGVVVLALHEVESILCSDEVVRALASHLGKDPEATSAAYLSAIRTTFQRQTLNNVVARRVRARVGDLLDGAFNGDQVVDDSAATAANHSTRLAILDLPGKVSAMFGEELTRVSTAIGSGSSELLALLPGKHMLSILAQVLGTKGPTDIAALVISALNVTKATKKEDALVALCSKLEVALGAYLPARTMVSKQAEVLTGHGSRDEAVPTV